MGTNRLLDVLERCVALGGNAANNRDTEYGTLFNSYQAIAGATLSSIAGATLSSIDEWSISQLQTARKIHNDTLKSYRDIGKSNYSSRYGHSSSSKSVSNPVNLDKVNSILLYTNNGFSQVTDDKNIKLISDSLPNGKDNCSLIYTSLFSLHGYEDLSSIFSLCKIESKLIVTNLIAFSYTLSGKTDEELFGDFKNLAKSVSSLKAFTNDGFDLRKFQERFQGFKDKKTIVFYYHGDTFDTKTKKSFKDMGVEVSDYSGFGDAKNFLNVRIKDTMVITPITLGEIIALLSEDKE